MDKTKHREPFEAYMCVLLLGAMILLMTVEVISRYIFNSSLPWSEELVRYIFVWFIFISASYTAEKKVHIHIETFADMVPLRIRPYTALLGMLVWLAFSLTAAFIGIIYSLNILNINSAALKIPMSIVYLGIPIGYVFMSFRVFQQVVENIKDLFKSRIGKSSNLK